MAENGATRTETFPVGIVGVGLAERDAAGPGRRAAAAAAERRACRHRQAASAPERPGQGHRRDPLHRRRRAAGHAVRPHPALAPRARRGARHRHVRGRARSAGARDRSRNPPRRSGACGRSLCRAAGRRDRGDLDGRGGRGAAPHPRRLQAAALRRRSRRGAPAGIGESLRCGVRAGKFGRERSSRRPACRSTATCAGPPRRAAATSRRASPTRTSSSKANTARRCRRIAAWSRTASSPIGAPKA